MIKTEMRNQASMNLHNSSTKEILEIIQKENYNAAKAIEPAIETISCVCDEIAERMKRGGRLIYIGAGTSGRLGVLDASECPPTFGVSSELVCGIIAGGYERLVSAGEASEDMGENGINDIKQKRLTINDTVLGISVAGNAAYVADALQYAKEYGCFTVGLTCNENGRLAKEPHMSIITDTGAEVVTGSTRMKAGTAHKMVLNMISTTVMIKLGNVYENLMINLKPSNIKLKNRVISIVCEILGCETTEAQRLLEANDWCIRDAIKNSDK